MTLFLPFALVFDITIWYGILSLPIAFVNTFVYGMIFSMNFRELLTLYRERAGIKKYQLGELISKSPAYMAQVEDGIKTVPTAYTLKDLIQVLNLSREESYEFVFSALKERDIVSDYMTLLLSFQDKENESLDLTPDHIRSQIKSFIRQEYAALFKPKVSALLSETEFINSMDLLSQMCHKDQERVYRIISRLSKMTEEKRAQLLPALGTLLSL